MLLSIAGPTDLSLHEVNEAADHITRVAHPDANIIFGAVVDDALGEEVRVTVDRRGLRQARRASASTASPFESRLSRLLEEPDPLAGVHEARPAVDPAPRTTTRTVDVFTTRTRSPIRRAVSFDAEEDLDIPDFLKS